VIRLVPASIRILLVVLAVPVTAQQSEEPTRQNPVFRSSANLVALNVTVTGPDKRFVAGLGASDFAVYEDGVQQEVRFFESADVPLDLILLLDTSASMRHRLDVVHRAAVGFLGTLRDGDRGAVLAFNDGVDVLQPLTDDRAALEKAIRGTTAQGGTALHNAIYVALKQFGRAAQQSGSIRRQSIAVLSDGDDTASLISFDDVLEVARKSGVNIYPIALESEYSRARRMAPVGNYFSGSSYSMRKLAQETGAQAFFPKRIEELTAVYDSISQELSNQYSIGYYAPRNTRSDGRFRRILVRVTSRPELQPRARMGYVAQRETSSFDEQDR
jgi:Ca-activated chloride channel family protein